MLNELTRGMFKQSAFDGVVDRNFADDVYVHPSLSSDGVWCPSTAQ